MMFVTYVLLIKPDQTRKLWIKLDPNSVVISKNLNCRRFTLIEGLAPGKNPKSESPGGLSTF